MSVGLASLDPASAGLVSAGQVSAGGMSAGRGAPSAALARPADVACGGRSAPTADGAPVGGQPWLSSRASTAYSPAADDSRTVVAPGSDAPAVTGAASGTSRSCFMSDP
ncbi:hypothetical protein [Candidatus Protofrankia datiscae]|uniref:hypothetical protein n=1 Tax=Candidatus Protofrankia datiscae TaxID=2716812 RepID=UPI001040FA69|nr:hypothetical protein [Candidatus Protofrankia datiscae]